MSSQILSLIEKMQSLKTAFEPIGCAQGFGAKYQDTKFGPASFLPDDLIINCPCDPEFPLAERFTDPIEREALFSYFYKLGDKVESILKQNKKPLVIGGDHSLSIGTISGFKKFHHDVSNIAVVWIDAHLDSHTPETSPSQKLHGMPLAVLMGHGQNDLCSMYGIDKKLQPENLFIIGARSYEQGELDLLKKLNVRVYFKEEVDRRGFETCFSEILSTLSQKALPFAVSLDLDVMDPSFGTGFGSQELGGISPNELYAIIEKLSLESLCKMIEIVEYNPTLDVKGETKNVIINLINHLTHARASHEIA